LKSKRQLWLGVVFAFMVFGMLPVLSQEAEDIPDSPEEIRKLPDTYKENYTDSVYDYVETVSLWSRLRSWLFDRLASLFNVGEKGASTIAGIVELIFWVVIILVVIYIIVKFILKKEIRWIFKKRREKGNALSFEIHENIQETDFTALIANAVANKDFRMAIRYHYLFLLKKLDQFDFIDFNPQKTAFDYQMEVQDSKYTSAFDKATYYYTYIWYGEFMIDEKEYGTTSAVYERLVKQIGA